GQELHHQHATQAGARIDPELRVENARPTQAPGPPVGLGVRRVGRDLETQAELVMAAPNGNGRVRSGMASCCKVTSTEPIWFLPISRTDFALRIRVLPRRPSLRGMR